MTGVATSNGEDAMMAHQGEATALEVGSGHRGHQIERAIFTLVTALDHRNLQRIDSPLHKSNTSSAVDRH